MEMGKGSKHPTVLLVWRQHPHSSSQLVPQSSDPGAAAEIKTH